MKFFIWENQSRLILIFFIRCKSNYVIFQLYFSNITFMLQYKNK